MNPLADLPVTLKDILAAHERIKDAIYRSPCPYSLQLSQLCGCNIYCKLDHLQMTGSFKERGREISCWFLRRSSASRASWPPRRGIMRWGWPITRRSSECPSRL